MRGGARGSYSGGTMATTDIVERLKAARLIPVIVIENADDAVPLCRALKEGGLGVAEVTFRTAAAAESIRRICAEFPEFATGAGTVTTVEEVKAAKAAGAQFAVAPGCNPTILKAANEAGLPFFPGVATPSEVEMALEAGCELLKFFPASQVGGPEMIKTLSGVYGHRGGAVHPDGGGVGGEPGELFADQGGDRGGRVVDGAGGGGEGEGVGEDRGVDAGGGEVGGGGRADEVRRCTPRQGESIAGRAALPTGS